jgi:exonuclease-1
LADASALVTAGNVHQALKNTVASIDVDPDLAHLVLRELCGCGWKCIVAPYEADAQLAYLSRAGLVDFVISEDSDLLVFGARKVLYKLDFSTLVGQ